MGALFATQAQKTVGQNPTIEKSIELVFDKIGQTRSGLRLDLGEECLEVFLYQLIERRLFGTPPFVMYVFVSGCGLNRRLVDERLQGVS